MHALAAKALYAEALGVGISSVAGRARPFFRGKKLKIEVKHRRDIVAKPAENATLEVIAKNGEVAEHS